MKMSLWNKWVGGVALASLGAVAIFAGSVGAASIVGSKHDLSVSGPGGKFTFASGATEICVFCHTPHGADITAVSPLWNRVATGAAYTAYVSPTGSLSGTVTMASSPSLVCLSCHDGTVAMNNLINAPGSGGYNSAGALAAGTWTAGGNVLATGLLGAGITNIGADLRNDHPVGVPYAGGTTGANPTAGADWTSATFKDTAFNTAKGAAGVTGWWVDVTANGTAGVRDKTDMWLYTRTVGAFTGPYVECASCHQPHDNAYTTFLRNTNAASGLCLACHVK